MNRQLLRAVMVLGLIVTLVGGTGIFALFTDRATTGINDVSSGELGHAADLQITTGQIEDSNQDGLPDVTCGTFQDDLATSLYSLTDLQPGNDEYAGTICLRNAGSSNVELTMSAIDLADLDIECTGDEAAYGDLSCGDQQVGELSPLIRVAIIFLDCDAATYIDEASSSLSGLAQQPTAIQAGSLLQMPPGDTACYSLRLRYPDTASATDIQLAQSDKVQWRFAFDGTVPSA
jgi:hypothetical protein